jgi:phosphotriesterase-related protein
MNLNPAKKGEAQTVTGPVSADQLGIVMMHEHLLLDVCCYFHEPIGQRDRAIAHQPVSLKNLSWIRRNWTSNLDNMRLDDEVIAIEEVSEYKLAGGATIVDVGNIGLARNPIGLHRIAQATGLQIVMGCGYYVDLSHPTALGTMTKEEIEEEIVRDIQIGVGESGIRAGIIGELGCSWPITPNEVKVLHAGAAAQRRTGAAITIHTGRNKHSPIEIAEILQSAGADMSRVVMGHLDREWPDFEILRRIARMGCVIAFDTFGQETWNYPLAPMDRLTDWQRVDAICVLVADGLLDQIVVSHDIGFKHRLSNFGGSGYHHILTTVRPVMRRKGLTESQLQTLLVDTPRRLLQIT